MQQFFGYENIKDKEKEPEKNTNEEEDNTQIDKDILKDDKINKQRQAMKMIFQIITSKIKSTEMSVLKNWQIDTVAGRYTNKIQSAAAMVDKMSKFSRNFIAVNSLNAVLAKKQLKRKIRRFSHWKNLTIESLIKKPLSEESKIQKESEEKILQAYKDSSK